MASEEGDDLFVSKLDEKSKEKAKRELNELNEEDRKIAVQTFRRWVLEHDWLKTPTDFKFLLRFLRARKFSQLGARENLENYWTCKAKMPQFYSDMDPADPVIQNVLRQRFAYSHKRPDSEGRRLLFCCPGFTNPEKIKQLGGLDNMYKGFALACEWLLTDENVQVNGLRLIVDWKDVGFQLWLCYSGYQDQKNMTTYFQKSIPMRMKAMYFSNETAFIDVIVSFFTQFFPQKAKERFYVTGKNLVGLYKHVDMSLLPDEYLPDDYAGPRLGSVDSVIDDMIEDMNKPEFRNYIRDLSSNKYGADLSKRKEEKHNQEEPAASFRKLNVD